MAVSKLYEPADFPNNLWDVNRLKKEILESQDPNKITVAFDSISSSETEIEITFKAELDAPNEAALDAIVAAHSGQPLPEDTGLKTDSFGFISTVTRKTIGENAVPWVTHNFCNPTTWWNNSLRVTHEELDNPTGDGTTWRSNHKSWIDMVHGLVAREDVFVNNTALWPTNSPFTTIVERSVDDGVTWTELRLGIDYVIDYQSGEVNMCWPNIYDPQFTHHWGIGNVSGSRIRATYNYAQHTRLGSTWTVKPNPGKILVIDKIEIQFSNDVMLTCPIVFSPKFFHPLYGLLEVPGATLSYKSAIDFMSESNQGTGYIEPWGGGSRINGEMAFGTKHRTLVFPFDYVSAIAIPSSVGGQLDISLLNGYPFGGEFANACLYTTEIDDPDYVAPQEAAP